MYFRKIVICALVLFFTAKMFSMDLNNGLVMHFDFKDAGNKPEIMDNTGKVKCISRQKILVVQEGALRIAPGAEIYIPAQSLPKITDTFTINTWLVKGYFGDISPVLFKGIHPEAVQFLLSVNRSLPEFCYKNELGQMQWKGIYCLGLSHADTGWVVAGKDEKIVPGYWTMFSTVFDRGSIKIYLNGQLVLNKVSVRPEMLKHNDFPIYIGAERIPNEKLNYRTGNLLINDLRLYDKALTDDDLKALYMAEKDKYPQKNFIPAGMLALKPCDEYLTRMLEGYDPEFRNKLKITADFEKEIPDQPLPGHDTTTSQVKPSNGVSGLFINGKEQYPVIFNANDIVKYQNNGNHSFQLDTALPAIRDFAAAGIELFGSAFIPPIFWTGEGKYDFAMIDNVIRQELAANPQGKMEVQFYLRPHGWFFSKYGEEMEKYYPGMDSKRELKAYNSCGPLGSKIWIECSSKLVYDVVRYIESQDYADRIFGYKICGGDAGEWYWAASFVSGMPGYSKATRASFQNWLKNKYKSNVELQKSWNNQLITFEAAEVPTPEFRVATEKYIFRNPAQARPALDYREYMIDISYENILQSCKALKEASNFKKNLTVYSGYSLLHTGKGTNAHTGGLELLSKVFRCQYVDGIATPLDYNKRRGGEPGANINAFNGSALLHNKLLWHENDLRTHLYPVNEFGRTADLQESLTVLKRGFGQSLIFGAGFWWFSIVGNSIFHQEDMMQTIARIGKLASQSIGKDRKSVAEVAMIFDERSTLFTSVPKDNFIDHHAWGVYQNAFRMGTPFDMYLLDDLDNPAMPDYKLYIMLNTYYTDSKTREMINNKLRKKNAVIVWCYAPGWITPDGFDTKAMELLTGFKFKVSEEQVKMQLSISDKNHPITSRADKMESYLVGPIFSVDDPEAKIIGTAGGMPALATKENENCRMVYSLMPLTVELLQGLCDYAGVHVYSRSSDVFIMNKSYIMLHTSTAGDKTIQLQDKYNIEELFSGKKMGQPASQIIEKNLPAQETRIYHISQ